MVESDATTVMSSILLGARLFSRTTLTLEASSTFANIVGILRRQVLFEAGLKCLRLSQVFKFWFKLQQNPKFKIHYQKSFTHPIIKKSKPVWASLIRPRFQRKRGENITLREFHDQPSKFCSSKKIVFFRWKSNGGGEGSFEGYWNPQSSEGQTDTGFVSIISSEVQSPPGSSDLETSKKNRPKVA